ncbi:MAG TPA: (2Fe-2S)-binding protein [Candidatus Thermoplasmatota archaeon]|nr:(2Fe-2S)-binding protein [Candidatus Thermoplasmatota archaeon]
MTTPKCIVCTCEDVNDVELRDAIDAGCADLESLKRFTGFGTGPCQGKTCVTLARRILADATGAPATAAGITYRAPTQPVPLRLLAGEEER